MFLILELLRWSGRRNLKTWRNPFCVLKNTRSYIILRLMVPFNRNIKQHNLRLHGSWIRSWCKNLITRDLLTCIFINKHRVWTPSSCYSAGSCCRVLRIWTPVSVSSTLVCLWFEANPQMSFPDFSRWHLYCFNHRAAQIHCGNPSQRIIFPLFWRSGRSVVCLTSMTLSPLGKSEMLPLRSWPLRLEWRWQFASPTPSMTWTSEFIWSQLFFWSSYLHIRLGYDIFLLLFLTFRIIELNGGQSPLTYKRFQTLISRMDPVEMPAESITAEIMGKCSTPLSEDHDDKFGVPSLEELGELSQKSNYVTKPEQKLWTES